MSIEECQYIIQSKHLPLKLLIKLLPYMEKNNKLKLIFSKGYFKYLSRNLRRRIFRLRISKTEPFFELFGIKII